MKPIRLLLLFLSFCPLAVYAQTAEVGGAVQDPSGAVIPKASVEFRNQDTGVRRQTITNNDGLYRIVGIDPGKYDATVQAKGFKTLTRENVIFEVGDKAQIDFKMQVGQSSQSVTVDGSGLQINVTDGSVSTVIDRKFVENIPLNGRSFQDLISLTPGVVTQSPQASSFLGGQGDFSVNGQRTESNTYIVDGISSNTSAGYGAGTPGPGTSGSLSASTVLGTTQSLTSVDALQEFRVESSTYSAEYGRSPGGQFSFVTRSGTSSFHGSIFDYLRNNYFDANDWFNDHYGIAEPALRQNDFGGTIGGPLVVFHHLKNPPKTFFFLSYEGMRLTQPTEASLQYVPSESLRQSAPSSLQGILEAFPVPTGTEIGIPCDNVTFQCPSGEPLETSVPSGLSPFVKAYSLPSKIDSTSVRLDRVIGSRFHAFARASYTPSSSYARNLSSYGPTRSNLQTYSGGFDFQVSNTTNNELRFGYSRSLATVTSALDNFGGAQSINLAQAFGTGGYPHAQQDFYYQITGIGDTYLVTQNNANYGRQWNITDTLSKTIGRHTFKAGVQYLRISSPTAPQDPELTFEYESPNSILTAVPDYGDIYRQVAAEPVYNEFALFGQDEWRVTPALNLSLGLRWDVDPAPHSGNSNVPYPLLGNPSDPSTYRLGEQGAQLYPTTWDALAPRFGLAWTPRATPDWETVFRAGVGLFFDTGTSSSEQVFASLGTTADSGLSNLVLPVTPAQLNVSFAVTPPYPTAWFVVPNFRLPYTIEWDTAIEQALGKHQALTLSYVASSGQRLVKENEVAARTENSDFTYVILYQNGATSNYQALQVKFQRQIARGLQALGSYSWSHSFDFGSSNGDFAYIRGNSNFDLRNSFNAALSWNIPSRNFSKPMRALTKDWALDGREIARTGFPVTLVGSAYFDPITHQGTYAGLNFNPSVPLYLYGTSFPGGRAINPKAFSSTSPGVQGTAPRNFVRGFGEQQINIAVRREFPLSENARLQFRAESFNVLNRPDFGYVDPKLSDATFGQATNTLAQSLGTVSPLYQQGGARSMQFALKVIF